MNFFFLSSIEFFYVFKELNIFLFLFVLGECKSKTLPRSHIVDATYEEDGNYTNIEI